MWVLDAITIAQNRRVRVSPVLQVCFGFTKTGIDTDLED